MRPKGQVSKGGALAVWDWVAHFKYVGMSKLGGSRGMLPCKSFKFKPLEMAGNFFASSEKKAIYACAYVQWHVLSNYRHDTLLLSYYTVL